jgi:hypothetical protein
MSIKESLLGSVMAQVALHIIFTARKEWDALLGYPE